MGLSREQRVQALTERLEQGPAFLLGQSDEVRGRYEAWVREYVLPEVMALASGVELLAPLELAKSHIEHMAAWIGARNAGYSFEALGEDMPGIEAAIAKAGGRP